MTKVRNIGKTWYRDAKIGLEVAPGATATLPDHVAHELCKQLRWHFEIVKDEAPAAPAPVVDAPRKRKRGEW